MQELYHRVLMTLLGAALTGQAGLSHAQSTWQHSAPRAGCLLEMYTSELCAYCQKAEQWLASNQAQRKAPVYLAAYHVDTFDTPDSKDPFAQPRMTARHKAYRSLGAVDFIATPQFFYNGVELKNWKQSLSMGCKQVPKPLGIRPEIDFSLQGNKARLAARLALQGQPLPAYNVKLHVALNEKYPSGKIVTRFLSDSLDINQSGLARLKHVEFVINPSLQFEVLVFAQNIHTLQVLETWSIALEHSKEGISKAN